MSFSLYEAVVSQWLQMLHSTQAIVDKAEVWIAEQGIAEADIVGARLIEDMYDFAYQVKSAAVHSQGAIEGVRAGNFQRDVSVPARSLAGLSGRLGEAIAMLEALDRAEVDGYVGRPMQFSLPQAGMTLPFTAENFLLSFSLPNFYFHVTTAYDLLRGKGMNIGKADYIGKMRIKKD